MSVLLVEPSDAVLSCVTPYVLPVVLDCESTVPRVRSVVAVFSRLLVVSELSALAAAKGSKEA